MRTLRNKSSAPTEQRTGAQTLKILLADEMPSEQPEPIGETEKHIVLYLREGLKGVERNWTKYPNNIHGAMRDHLDKSSDGILYVYMWWRSWGFGRNFCRISQKQAVDETVIDSIRTVKRSLDTLAEKCFIVKAMTEDEEIDTTKQGTLYRVMTPKEIDDQMTEEGIPFSDIPIEGIFMPRITPDKINGAKMSGVGRKYGKHSNNNSSSNGRKNDRGKNDRGKNDRGTPDKNSPDKIDWVAVNADNNNRDDNTRKIDRAKNVTPFKEDSLKDSLSPDHIVTGFYTGIGQEDISDDEREKALGIIEKLQNTGRRKYDLEEIDFAAKWIAKNKTEPIRTFGILPSIMGQAMRARRRADQAEAKEMAEEAARIAEEKEQQRVQEYKDRLSKRDRVELRQRAETEIRESGEYQEQFITEHLISAKESEILLREHKLPEAG